MGEDLLGPTLLAFGTPEQKGASCARSPKSVSCSARATPNPAPARISPRCRLQHTSGSKRSADLSYLLVPIDQPGITIRPIRQLAGKSEFNEVFSTMGDVISAGSQHAWLTSRPHPSPRSCLRGDLCWPQRRQRCSFCGQQPGSITPGA